MTALFGHKSHKTLSPSLCLPISDPPRAYSLSRAVLRTRCAPASALGPWFLAGGVHVILKILTFWHDNVPTLWELRPCYCLPLLVIFANILIVIFPHLKTELREDKMWVSCCVTAGRLMRACCDLSGALIMRTSDWWLCESESLIFQANMETSSTLARKPNSKNFLSQTSAIHQKKRIASSFWNMCGIK